MNDMKSLIAVVDDEKNILLSIESCLSSKSIAVDCYSSAGEALIGLQRHVYDCALIDIRLGEESGIELFKRLRASGVNTPIIFISGNASLDEAAKSQQLGAFDFIEKPFSIEKLKITLDNCLKYHQLENKLNSVRHSTMDIKLIGEHKLMTELKRDIGKVAKTSAAVLINGESGTGKELIASAIHRTSSRANNAMVKVNCSAIPENLIESALFGHLKGSFTGATETKSGYFEQAHKSTLFLDEIGDMSLAGQSSLLRVLESGEIQKIGAPTITEIDVRVIAATHKDLAQEVALGNFRQDLYYRLNVIPLFSPPLRERSEDIPLLVDHLLSMLCKRHGIPQKVMEDSCLADLINYSWPGNIRELNNTLERMIIMGGDNLDSRDIPKDINSNTAIQNSDISLKNYRRACDRKLILQRLKQYKGNISKVARSLDIDRTNLHKKMKVLKISRESEFKLES